MVAADSAASSVMSSFLASSVRNPRETLGDYGVLQRFAPQSATTWWAMVESNLTAKTFGLGKPREYFEAEKGAAEAPKVQF